ncbi:hypothetical protein ACLB2K_004935 [Fragaria x ananassa]
MYINRYRGQGRPEVAACDLEQYEEPYNVEFDGATHGTSGGNFEESVCKVTSLRPFQCPRSCTQLRGEVLRLPPSHSTAQQIGGPNSKAMYISTHMGFDSITNTYKILRVTDIFIPKFHVSQVLVLGTSEWRQVTSPPAKALFRFENICAHGDMHWPLYPYTREGIQGQVHILSFDFKKEEFFWIPNPYILQNTRNQLHLINFRGYYISIQVLELDPQFKFSEAVCCEWEHGIPFLLDDDESATLTLFLDLRGPVVTKNLVKCPIEGKLFFRRIMSLNGGLISLKRYADLEEAEELLIAIGLKE